MSQLSRVLVAAIVLIAAGAYFFVQQKNQQEASLAEMPLGQLPSDVVPTHYDLNLRIIPEEDSISGRVRIDVDVQAATDTIWLHGDGLIVSEAKVVADNGAAVAAQYEQMHDSGVSRLVLARAIPAGSHVIDISYTAPFNESLEGIYRVEEDGRAYAFSQMESIFARISIPSFDEPAFKTPYDTTLIVREDHVAISNTPVIEEESLGDGTKRLTFETTRPLPTYLLAFAVGELDVVDWAPIPATDVRPQRLPLRGVTAHGKGDQIEYALANTADIVLALEEYFGIAYPYSKLDIIAAPDYAWGAMENAGAIVYREQLLLLDENSPAARKRSYTAVHAHELAHQWFGNLVTMPWWDDIWLNEAFATWLSYKIAQEVKPQEKFETSTLRTSFYAMQSDSLANARQIRQPIESNDDIINAFDGITYSKGGAVLEMFEKFIGEEDFRRGLQYHMEKFRFGTATAEDFITSIATVTGREEAVSAFKVMLGQPGVPLLEVEQNCTGDQASVRVRQSRYLPVGSTADAAKQWELPVCLAFGNGAGRSEHCALLTGIESEIQVPGGQCPDYVMPNADGSGYYRWSLSGQGWESLAGALDQLSEKEVLAFADSLEAAFRAGRVSAGTYLTAAESLAQFEQWDIMQSPMDTLVFITDYLVAPENSEAMRARLRAIYAPVIAELGLDADTPDDASDPIGTGLRRRWAVYFMTMQARDPDLRSRLAERAKALIGFGGDGQLHLDAVAPDLMRYTLAAGVQELGAPYFDALLALVLSSKEAIFRENALYALSLPDDPALSERIRVLGLSSDLRVNEFLTIYFRQMAYGSHRDAAWDWVTAHFDEVSGRMPEKNRDQVVSLPQPFCSIERRDEVQAFFAPKLEGIVGSPRTLAQALEQVELCAALKDLKAAETNAFLTGG